MSKEKEELKQEEKEKLKVKAQEKTVGRRTAKITKIKEEEKILEEALKVEKTKAPKAATKKTTASTKKTVDKNKVKTAEKGKKVSSANVKKIATISKDKKEKSSKNIETSKKTVETKKATPVKEKKVKEESIIEKIKSFIAKIVAMQEEAKNEELAKKEKKKDSKKTEKEDTSSLLENPVYLTEYYDLPYRYNETVVKILAQTPKRMFVYWDIADSDRIRYENAFGKDFYEKTYPVLLLHNDDKNYTTEIPINDFANSWYIDIKDPKTKYTIQLGRKFREVPVNLNIAKIKEEQIVLHTDYLPIAQSNVLEIPNDRILFNKMPAKLVFRNVKTYEETQKEVKQMKTSYGKIYDIKEFYQNNYKEEIDEEKFDLNNPTSGGLSSSSFK